MNAHVTDPYHAPDVAHPPTLEDAADHLLAAARRSLGHDHRYALLEVGAEGTLVLAGDERATIEQFGGDSSALAVREATLLDPPPRPLEVWGRGGSVLAHPIGRRSDTSNCVLVLAVARKERLDALRWLEQHGPDLVRELRGVLAHEQARLQQQRLESLHAWVLRLGRIVEVDHLISAAGDAIANVFPGVSAWMVLSTADATAGVRYALVGRGARPLASDDVRTANTRMNEVMRRRAAAASSELVGSPYDDLRELAEHGYRSALHVPLLVAGDAIGVLVAASRASGQLDGSDALMFEHVGALLAAQLHARRTSAPGSRLGEFRYDELGTVLQLDDVTRTVAGLADAPAASVPLRRLFDASSTQRLLAVGPEGAAEPIPVVWDDRTRAPHRVAWATVRREGSGLLVAELSGEGRRVPIGHARMRATRRAFELLECISVLRSAEDLVDAVRLSLRRIATGHGASRATLWTLHDTSMKVVTEWVVPGASVTSDAEAPWLDGRLAAGSPWWDNTLASEASESSARAEEAAFWRRRGSQTTVCAPCGDGADERWFLSLEFVAEPRPSDPELAAELHWLARSIDMERARRDQQARDAARQRWWREVFAQLRDAVVIVGVDGRLRCANEAALKLLRRSEKELRAAWPHAAFVHADEWRDLASAAQQDHVARASCLMDRARHGEFQADVTVSLFDEGLSQTLQVVMKDATDRIAQEEVRRAVQEREIVDAMTAGVVHDFNNLLTPITTGVELLLRDPALRQHHESIRQILHASTRAQSLTRQLLDAHRGYEDASGTCELDRVIDEAVDVARSSTPDPVQFRVVCEPGLQVAIDAARLHQVLVNLMTNALRAVDKDGGRIGVSVSVEDGGIVQIEVADNGHGMSRVVVQRSFEPYFTTRARGVGTGLGLHTSRAILRSVGGDIYLESFPGSGTRVYVRVPLVEPGSQELPALPPDGAETNSPPVTSDVHDADGPDEASTSAGGGDGSIFVIDDQDVVGQVLVDILEMFEIPAHLETDARQALRKLQDGTRPSMIFCDVMMPGMDGHTFCSAVREMGLETPIVMVTGLAEGETVEAVRHSGANDVLHKPYRMHDIEQFLQRFL